MAYVDARAAICYGDCSESMPSSAASEDTLDIPESDISLARLQDAVSVLLQRIGEDTEREGLRDTPRVRFLMQPPRMLERPRVPHDPKVIPSVHFNTP